MTRLFAATAAAILVVASPLAAQWPAHPDAYCLPMGLMQFQEHPQPRTIVQTPDVIVILDEGNAGVRQIEFIRAENERSTPHMVGK